MVVLDRFFFIWETKKGVAGRVRQVVVLYSNGCMGICLGRLSTGCLIEVVVWTDLTVVWLKNSFPYVVKSFPETKVNCDWLNEVLIDCLRILTRFGFNIKAIVCDNHPPNVSSFKNLPQHFNQDSDELFIWYELRKIYLSLWCCPVWEEHSK